jgi:hypothetical protein
MWSKESHTRVICEFISRSREVVAGGGVKGRKGGGGGVGGGGGGGGGGKTKKKNYSQRLKNLSRYSAKKKIPCLEDRPINFT